MAKAYRAVTRIEHGQYNKDTQQNETFVFQPGDVVKGLDKDVMKGLWDAGALESVDVVEVEKAAETPTEPPAE